MPLSSQTQLGPSIFAWALELVWGILVKHALAITAKCTGKLQVGGWEFGREKKASMQAI